MIKRKNFLFGFLSSLAATNGLSSCSRQSVVTWTMATTWDTKLQKTIYGGAEEICKTVEDLTAGEFKIQIQQEAKGWQPEPLFEAVKNQTIDCGHTVSFFYGKKEPALYFSSAIPFGFNPQKHNAWLYEGGGLDLIRKAYSKFNIINFTAGNTGSQMGGWFKKEIKRLSDLDGLKMRIPGLGALVMEELGVETKTLIPSNIFAALKNDLDAAEFTGPYDDLQLGLDRVADFYYFPGWWEPSTALDLIVNQEAWKALNKQYQQALKVACMKVNLKMLAKYDVLNVEAIGKFAYKNPDRLKKFSCEILQGAWEKTEQKLNQLSEKDSLFKEIKEHWILFGNIQEEWDNLTNVSPCKFQDSQENQK